MRKSVRWLSTLLIIALLFTGTVTGAYASENVQVDDLSTKMEGKVNESAMDKMPQIMEDLKILEDHGISADYLKEVSCGDKLTYEFQLPSVQEVTQISLRQYDGGVIIEYTEGTKHDVVDHRDNGEVYLDGEKVEVVVDEEASAGVDISPRAGTRTEYSDTSFVSGGSYILDDNGSVIRVHTDKKLIEMAAATIADLLVSCLLGGFGIMVPIAKLMLHASSI